MGRRLAIPVSVAIALGVGWALLKDGSGLTLRTQYTFNSPGALPTCTGDAHCVAICAPNLDGVSNNWQCYSNSGALINDSRSTITQGTGATYVGTFGTRARAIQTINDTTAPSASGTIWENILGGDFTIVLGMYGFDNAAGAGTEKLFEIANGSDLTNYLSCSEITGTNVTCNTIENSTSINTLGGDVIGGGWRIFTFRRTGNSRVARTNGSTGAAVNTVATRSPNPGAAAYFGRARSGVTGFYLNGPYAFAAIYDEGKSNSWVDSAEAAWWGSASDVSAGWSGTSTMGLDNSATSGQVDIFGTGAHVVSPTSTLGFRTTSGEKNWWATDALDVTTATAVNTPVPTTNVQTGPFSRWKNNTAECDLVVDDNGAAFEGYASQDMGTGLAVNSYTAAFFLRSGTSGVTTNKARIQWVTTGTPSVDHCDISSLTSSVSRYSCTTQISGTPTSVKAQLLVGNAAADTGSIIVCHGQLNSRPYAEVSLTTTATNAAWLQLDSSSWPALTVRGKYEVVWSPLYDINSNWTNQGDAIYLLDAYDPVLTHQLVIIPGYNTAGRLMARTTNTGGSTEFDVDGTSTTAGQLYASSVEWLPTSSGHCLIWFRHNSCSGSVSACSATTVVGSSLDGSGWCPGQPSIAKLGQRYDNSLPTSVFVSAVRIFR